MGSHVAHQSPTTQSSSTSALQKEANDAKPAPKDASDDETSNERRGGELPKEGSTDSALDSVLSQIASPLEEEVREPACSCLSLGCAGVLGGTSGTDASWCPE